jgi:RND family efflux transporter MFP subunit
VTFRTFVALIAATATTAACSRTPERAAAEPATPIEVTTARAAMTPMPATFEGGGIVRASLTAAIASRVMAQVVEVRVRPGDRVRRGTPLIILDAREMTANRDRAVAAALAAQQSSIAADADVAAAEANLTLARVTHRRIAELASKTAATPQELDQAVATLTAAEAQLRSVQARRAATSAARDAALATSNAADTGLTYSQLTAPFDAVVSERAVDPGAMATPGAPLLTLEDPASFRLEVRLDESRAAGVRVGQSVEISYGDKPVPSAAAGWTTGRVGEIGRLDPASHSFVVKIDVPQGADVRSGSFGRARFTGTDRIVLTVPESSLVRRGQLTFVFAVDMNNVARLRAISPGFAARGQIVALAGITDGDVVVVNPPPGLTDACPIRTVSAVAQGDRQ